MTEQSDLAKYLTMVTSMAPAPDHFKYRSYESFVLAEGQLWTDTRVETFGLYKQCYENAYSAAQINGWEYVEGYATSLIPIGHAWCLDGDQVVETTWETPGAEYWGIVMSRGFVSEAMLTTGYWGVMPNDYLNGFQLLKEGTKAIENSDHPRDR